MAKKFKFQEKPIKPERMLLNRTKILLGMYNGNPGPYAERSTPLTPAQVCDLLKDVPADAVIQLVHSYDYDHCSDPYLEATWQSLETDAEFDARMQVYSAKLAKYLEWEVANKEALADYLQKKEQRAKQAKAARVNALNQQIKKLKKELENEEAKP